MPLLYEGLHPDFKPPTKAYVEDAGWDVYSVQDIVINPGMVTPVHTGGIVAYEPLNPVPGIGWYLRAADKSGLALKHGIHVLAGVIDEGYRGELVIVMTNLGFWSPDGKLVQTAFTIHKGDKICQLVPEAIWRDSQAREVRLGTTSRGTNGFGSSGV